MNKYQQITLRIVGIVVVLLGLSLLVFSIFVSVRSYSLDEEELRRVEKDSTVRVQEKFRYTTVEPLEYTQSLIYYPGGLVTPESYLPNAIQFAEAQEVRIFIPKVPYNAAIFGIWMADWISYREGLDTFWVGGHSLGGIAACRYTNRASEKVEGLILHGSYCDQDISDFSGEVISIMGDNDQIINRENYQQAKENLPDDAQILEIEGLNHSAFGSYGLQKGDGGNQYSGNPWEISKITKEL